jgi:hypothetical protein
MKRVYGIVYVNSPGCECGYAQITGREGKNRFWVVMVKSGWNCIVNRGMIETKGRG